ncbi:MAG: hypothetical protein QOK19_1388, partial [Solirubrobacteraceae bacterium]|nr:hypothetical protein [Solirubrobacteraceae bacterium]
CRLVFAFVPEILPETAGLWSSPTSVRSVCRASGPRLML